MSIVFYFDELSFVNRVEHSYDSRCFIKHIYALVRCSDDLSIAVKVLKILLLNGVKHLMAKMKQIQHKPEQKRPFL